MTNFDVSHNIQYMQSICLYIKKESFKILSQLWKRFPIEFISYSIECETCENRSQLSTSLDPTYCFSMFVVMSQLVATHFLFKLGLSQFLMYTTCRYILFTSYIHRYLIRCTYLPKLTRLTINFTQERKVITSFYINKVKIERMQCILILHIIRMQLVVSTWKNKTSR